LSLSRNVFRPLCSVSIILSCSAAIIFADLLSYLLVFSLIGDVTVPLFFRTGTFTDQGNRLSLRQLSAFVAFAMCFILSFYSLATVASHVADIAV